jgi:hypothetical protein
MPCATARRADHHFAQAWFRLRPVDQLEMIESELTVDHDRLHRIPPRSFPGIETHLRIQGKTAARANAMRIVIAYAATMARELTDGAASVGELPRREPFAARAPIRSDKRLKLSSVDACPDQRRSYPPLGFPGTGAMPMLTSMLIAR